MSRIGSKNTGPELAVRSLVHRMGYRFRLYRPDLPGKPDLAFPGMHKVIFVHGCFWHGHYCKRDEMPKSRIDYWGEKVLKNQARDLRNRRELGRLGWESLVVWECEVKKPDRLANKIKRFLSG